MEIVSNFSEFLAMGTHGVYVWSSYAITLASLVGLFIYLRRQRRNRIARIKSRSAAATAAAAKVTVTTHGEDS